MKYVPAGKANNALLQVAFIIEFERNFSQEDFLSVNSMRSAWFKELPRQMITDGLPSAPLFPNTHSSTGPINGLVYEELNRDGTVRMGLSIEKNKLIFLVGEYTKWNLVWPIVEKILKPVHQYLYRKNFVGVYSVEYKNLFLYKGDYFDSDISELLKPDNFLIPHHIFERKLNWHFHTGFFEEKVDPAAHRLLTRINFDMRDNLDSEQRELTLFLFFSLFPPGIPYSKTLQPLPDEIIFKGLDNFKTLHNNARETMKQLICKDVLKVIDLF